MDGCTLANDPDNQRCCSTSDPGVGLPNWWRVDFDQYYIIDEGIITGRSGNCLDVVYTLQNDSLYRMFKLSKTFAQNCFMVLILNFDCRLLVYLHVKTLFISATAIRS